MHNIDTSTSQCLCIGRCKLFFLFTIIMIYNDQATIIWWLCPSMPNALEFLSGEKKSFGRLTPRPSHLFFIFNSAIFQATWIKLCDLHEESWLPPRLVDMGPGWWYHCFQAVSYLQQLPGFRADGSCSKSPHKQCQTIIIFATYIFSPNKEQHLPLHLYPV